jgi:hypothetical protein
MKRPRLILPLLFGILFVFLLTQARTAPAADPRFQNADPTPPFDDRAVVVRAYFSNPDMVADLAAWKEPWEVNYEEGFVVVDADPSERMLLELSGFRLDVDEKLTAQINQPQTMLPGQLSGIPGFPCYRTVEETFQSAEELAAAYPALVDWIDIGDSWEKSEGLGGYDLNVLRLTNEAVPGPKPKLYAMSSIHAREYTPAELVTRFAEHLAQNYDIDPDITWLLDYHELHLLLQANPDARKKAEGGLFWRKNTNQNYCGPNSDDRGADLNRNFQFQWGCCGGSSSNQCAETYRGPSPASEPETQSVQNYVFSNYPDLRDPPIDAAAPLTTTGLFLDIHSSGDLVLWPWGFTEDPTGNGIQLQTLGRKLAYFNGYFPEQAIGLYPTDGTTDDFAYGELGLPAFTYELGTNFFQSCGYFEDTILPENIDSLLYAAKIAREPYLLPAGPDVIGLALSSPVVGVGEPVTLTVTLNDTRFNNSNGSEPVQPVAGGEFYIDTPYWITTTIPLPFPLAPADGTFDSSIEGAVGTIDTSSLSPGRHTVFVRGQDLAGNWGAVSAMFLFVIDPAVAPTIEGEVRAADTGAPLAATVSAGVFFQTATDPLSGAYQMQVISGTYDLKAIPGSPEYGHAEVVDVPAYDFQTVEQDFLLYPYCTLFADDVENGNPGWVPQLPWAITTESAHSPVHSWTDSPGGPYDDNLDISLTSPVFDLSGYSGIQLDYWQICDTEAGYDFCEVEVSDDGGTTWTSVASFDGPQAGWENINLALPLLDYQAQARLRFRFSTDVAVTDDGWHLDDIELRGAGPGCISITAPLAGFSSSSPDLLGETTQFTNTSTGSALEFLWDFGDGSGVVTEAHPSHSYLAAGIYTVTLSASNSAGSDSFTSSVEIEAIPLPAYDYFIPILRKN